jgi:hypothetical protein
MAKGTARTLRRPDRAEECQRLANERFARAHPDKAREERALRKRQGEVAERFGRNDTAAATPETRFHASQVRQGALARLCLSGAIDADQLASACEIAAVAERIAGEVRVRTVSLETRIDNGGRGQRPFFEALNQVRAEQAYTAWRKALPRPAPVLAMIVEDRGANEIARTWRMDKRTAVKLLIDALDAWPKHCAAAWKAIDAADLAAFHAGLI